MLDAGVIAEDQLEKLFRAKGFELNITGWKNMPGPVKRIVQTSYKEGDEDNKTTTIIEEQEDIKVPIIGLLCLSLFLLIFALYNQVLLWQSP